MSRQVQNEVINYLRTTPTFGTFLDVSRCSEGGDIVKKYNLEPQLVSREPWSSAVHDSLRGRSAFFDKYLSALDGTFVPHAEQCSGQYYLDLMDYIEKNRGVIKHVCEVGVFLGGASQFLIQAAEDFDFTLDLIDVNPHYLGFAYERLLAIFPTLARRVRIFHGDFPSYVKSSGAPGHPSGVFVQFDGSHEFPIVVKDLVALNDGRGRFKSFAIQDTHLRSSNPDNEVFVDMAVYAVFGKDVKCRPIGIRIGENDVIIPNNDWEIYFKRSAPEGFLIELNENPFDYPRSLN